MEVHDVPMGKELSIPSKSILALSYYIGLLGACLHCLIFVVKLWEERGKERLKHIIVHAVGVGTGVNEAGGVKATVVQCEVGVW